MTHQGVATQTSVAVELVCRNQRPVKKYIRHRRDLHISKDPVPVRQRDDGCEGRIAALSSAIGTPGRIAPWILDVSTLSCVPAVVFLLAATSCVVSSGPESDSGAFACRRREPSTNT